MKAHKFPSVYHLSLLLLILASVGCSYGVKNYVRYNKIEMTLSADRDRLKPNEPVTFTLTLENTGTRVEIFESTDTPVFDLRFSTNSKTLALWSAENPELVLHRLELKPGEIERIQTTWSLKPEDGFSGTLVGASAVLYNNSRPIQNVRVSFCIDYC